MTGYHGKKPPAGVKEDDRDRGGECPAGEDDWDRGEECPTGEGNVRLGEDDRDRRGEGATGEDEWDRRGKCDLRGSEGESATGG